jgi:hypothetical protein
MKVFHNPDNKRIDCLDERFYTVDGETFFPSVTTVLQVYPKGFGYEKWLKENADDAEDILREAGEQGSKVHDAIDRIIKGEEVTWVTRQIDTFQLSTVESHQQYIQDVRDGFQSKYIREVQHYTLLEWQMVLRFMAFCEQCSPEFEANEINLIVDEVKLGGTLDIVCMIRGERWLIDVKTSNYIHKTHELQLAAYTKMWNIKNPDFPIDRVGILWLKAQTRGEDKKGEKIQGAGWQLKEFEKSWQENWRLFQHVRAIWDEENPNYRPKNLIYPDRVSLQLIPELK